MAAPFKPITMPKWGIEMTEGTISGWRVKEGDPVERGAEILDVETEKIVNAVEAPASGVLRRITATAGDTRSVGSLIGVIADAETSDADIARFVEGFSNAAVTFDGDTAADASAPSAQAGAAAPGTAATNPGPEPAVNGAEEARISPIASRIAERLGVDLTQVVGTGRNGRISKEDVEAYATRAAGAAAPTSAQPASVQSPTPPASRATNSVHRRIRMSARRTTIARRLLESKQAIPHYRLDIDVDVGRLQNLRHERTTGSRVTLNDLLLRATALALVQHPLVNAQLEGDEILQFDNADIAIAVDTDEGLVTPILRSANLKTLATIAEESRELIARARSGSLKREDITGGSFTISNLGMYGVTRFDAIINPPQVAILAVGAARARAVVRGGAVVVGELVTLTLSADHRVVDGAIGAAFLATLRKLLEEPASL